jgi:hypothetical protein
MSNESVVSSESMDELRRRFVIDESSYENKQMKDDLERIAKLCKVTSKGKVLIIDAQLNDKKKVGLVVIARYVGSRLEKGVPEIVSIDEIVTFTKIGKEVVSARASELGKEGFISREGKGKYKANPGRISDFLDDIEAK